MKLKSSPVNSKVNNGSKSYSERWSLHPGETLRRKRGISAKDQQARAKHPIVLPQAVFESRALRKKAFHGDKECLIFCGDVREVLGWLRDAGIFADCIVTSPPFYGQRDYGVPDQVADRSCMSHEYVFHFVTQRFYYYNRVAVGRKTSRGTYMPPTDTWEVPLSKGGTLHKASFSEELVRIPILATTPPKGIVLDPFAGSGTSL